MGNSMVLCFHGFNMVLITEQMGLLCRTSNRTHASQFISCHHWHSYRGILLHCLSKCSLHSHDKHHQHLQAYWMVSHFLQLLKLNQNKKISSLLSYIIQSLSQFLNSFDPCFIAWVPHVLWGDFSSVRAAGPLAIIRFLRVKWIQRTGVALVAQEPIRRPVLSFLQLHGYFITRQLKPLYIYISVNPHME